VCLDLGGGRFAFYEHLKQGSIKVKARDRVKSGQVLARLGNSGSTSSGPHLHFHVGDGKSELASEGLPYVFKNFEIVGAYNSIDAIGTDQRWTAAPPGHRRHAKARASGAEDCRQFSSQVRHELQSGALPQPRIRRAATYALAKVGGRPRAERGLAVLQCFNANCLYSARNRLQNAV
jgi:hypothetical protein